MAKLKPVYHENEKHVKQSDDHDVRLTYAAMAWKLLELVMVSYDLVIKHASVNCSLQFH